MQEADVGDGQGQDLLLIRKTITNKLCLTKNILRKKSEKKTQKIYNPELIVGVIDTRLNLVKHRHSYGKIEVLQAQMELKAKE